MKVRRYVEVLDHIVPGQPTVFETLAAGQAKHLRPLMWAVAEGGCRVAVVWQHAYRFDLTGEQPTIALIGDDTDRALGPAGFPKRSIRRLLESCRTVAVISSGVMAAPYVAVASVAALTKKNAAVIETRPEREHDWLAFVRSAAPGAQLIVCQPRRH